MPPGVDIPGINDSKQLSAAKREEVYEALMAHPEVDYATCDSDSPLNSMGRSQISIVRAEVHVSNFLPIDCVVYSHALILHCDVIPMRLIGIR